MKKILWIAALAGLMTGAVAQDVFYQSDFTGADLASAGLESAIPTGGGSWSLNTANDRAQFTGTGNARAHLNSTASWQSTAGFQVDVTFLCTAATWAEIGLQTVGVQSGNPSLQNNANFYGIGFAMRGGTQSAFARNTNNVAELVLSTAQGAYTESALQTLSFTVTSTNWSYSLNGQAATTGTFATPFDTSKSYRIDAFLQGANNSYISNIKVTTPGMAPPPDAKSVELIIYQ